MIRISDKTKQEFEYKHSEKVRDLASECVVLLKSDGTLPYNNIKKVALYGNGARKTIKGGTGSGDVNVRDFITVENGFNNANIQITSGDWLDKYDELIATERKLFVEEVRNRARETGMNPIMLGMGKVMPEPEYSFSLDHTGDAAIYVLARNSGEGSDREITSGDIELSQTEKRDILELNKKFDKFVLVLNVGGLVNLTPVNEVKNIILLSQLGASTGDVLVDVITGKTYPSGKLTTTWAPIETYPSTKGFADPNDTYYNEGIYVGYRYFDTKSITPIYPFGFGLSYTNFDIKVTSFFANEKEVTVNVKVKNIGNYAGKEVVQLYYSSPKGELDKPFQELASFIKTKELSPNEVTELSLRFNTSSMASYDTTKAAYVMEKGNYILRIGNSSRNTTVCGKLRLISDVKTNQLRNICAGWGFDDMVIEPSVLIDDLAGVQIISLDPDKFEQEKVQYNDMPTEICEAKIGSKTVDEFVESLSIEELAYLCVGDYDDSANKMVIGSAGTTVAGSAGETTHKLSDYKLNTLVMADGPAGLRLSVEYKVVDGKAKACSNALSEGFLEFLEPEMLMKMAEAQPKPTKEEIDAPVYYQYCTAIPIGTALAQSWNVDLCTTCGDIVGEEMEMFGVNLWLAPALNIHRSPLCGRNFEYYSEDPIVSGEIATAITIGVQKHENCGTTIKHFACNNQETNRYVSNSVVSERALREIYLKGFEICVRNNVQPKSLMTSYNLINGEHTCNSKDLLTDVLKNEWGYNGVVMTDWFATNSMSGGESAPKTKYTMASAAGCVKAGNHLTMPGTQNDIDDIINALSNNSHKYPLTKAELKQTAKKVVENILLTK